MVQGGGPFLTPASCHMGRSIQGGLMFQRQLKIQLFTGRPKVEEHW